MFEFVITLVVFLAPLAYSPGPGNMFFAANGARFGVRATLPANVGYHVATWIVTVAVGLGFAAANSNFPTIFLALKWAGAVYVLYLAWKLYHAGTLSDEAKARPAGFQDGVWLLLLNPKAYVIISLIFGQFLARAPGDLFWAVVVIATVFTLNNLIAFMAWTAIGDRIAAGFRDEDNVKFLNAAFSATLAIVALWMLLS